MPAPSAAGGFIQYMTRFSLLSSFFLSPVLPGDVENMNVTEKKPSTCMNSVQSMKVIRNSISPILTHLINNSSTRGVFPDFFQNGLSDLII